MDVVLEYCRLVDCRKVAGGQISNPESLVSLLFWGRGNAYPLVKTFSNEVLPQAPSPLVRQLGLASRSRSVASLCTFAARQT